MHQGLYRSYFVRFTGLPAKIFLKLEVLEVIFDFGGSLDAFDKSFWRLWSFFENINIARVPV